MSANEIVNPAETQEIFTHRNEVKQLKNQNLNLTILFSFQYKQKSIVKLKLDLN